MSMIFEITEATFDLVRESPIVALVVYSAKWCGLCKTVEPILEKLAEEYDKFITVCKIDVDSESAVAQNFYIMGVPTFQIWYKGAVLKQWSGVSPDFERDLRNKIDCVLEGQ